MTYSRFKSSISLLLAVFLLSCSSGEEQQRKVDGALSVCKSNPRYFTDGSGNALYLTGAHTWNNLVDMKATPEEKGFDYPAYIRWMKKYNFNFMRLWAWEILNWDTNANYEKQAQILLVSPHPWARTGPGRAIDGKPKFDLNQFDEEYFDRLRKRVELAGKNGIYVSIMLFEGWALQFSPHAFENHPFYPKNNINGINGDIDGDGKGLEIHTMKNKDILDIQEKYVKKVINVVNKYDNVLFEISNENYPPSTEWQYHMINFIKEYEKSLSKQHPVGMTFQYKGGKNQTLFNSPADWISPNPEGGYRENPPAGDGKKVVITDTDHLWGIGGNEQWVWKSFLRGLNPIFMDPYDGKVLSGRINPHLAERIRRNLGYTAMMANRIDLTNMMPDTLVASTGYCLANDEQEYLVYLPEGDTIFIDLAGTGIHYRSEWFDTGTGTFSDGPVVECGKKVSFISPLVDKPALLHIQRIQ